MTLFFTVSILVCKSLNGKTCQYSNSTFLKRQKSFSFAELNSQTCKALIRWKYHEIIWINHIAYMGGEYPNGGDIPRVFAPNFERGCESPGGGGGGATFSKIIYCPPKKIWVCSSNAPPNSEAWRRHWVYWLSTPLGILVDTRPAVENNFKTLGFHILELSKFSCTFILKVRTRFDNATNFKRHVDQITQNMLYRF
jgi:hypothetical protein